jgi:hypothetical protein
MEWQQREVLTFLQRRINFWNHVRKKGGLSGRLVKFQTVA